jgi:hypothetical protein
VEFIICCCFLLGMPSSSLWLLLPMAVMGIGVRSVAVVMMIQMIAHCFLRLLLLLLIIIRPFSNADAE